MKHAVLVGMVWTCTLLVLGSAASAAEPTKGGEEPTGFAIGAEPPYAGGGSPEAGAVILSNVPADYDWWNGCSPTAAGMLFGWWEEAGVDAFPGNHRNLPATYPGTSTNLADYQDARGVVAGWAHKQEGVYQGLSYGSYEYHAPDSLADFLLTVDGGTSSSDMPHGFETFGAWDDPRTPEIESRRFNADLRTGGDWSYAAYCAEIDAGRPVHLGLTSEDSGHSVLGVGYNNTDGKQNYVLLTTWHWGLQEWEWENETHSGRGYSVYAGRTMDAVTDPVPELSAYLSLSHSYIGDLTVNVGVGDPNAPDWVTTVWDGAGGGDVNLVLTDIDCTDVLADFLSSELTWFLEVTDDASLDQGTIEDFQVRYNFDSLVFGYDGSPVPIYDNQTAYAYLTTPEPLTLGLLAAGGLGLLLRRRRR